MSERESNEVRDLVNEVYNSTGFTNLREDDKYLRAILYGRHAEYLVKDLQEQAQFKTVVPVASPATDHYAHDAEEEVDETMAFRVTAHSTREKGRADQLETGVAALWNRLNPGGKAQRQIIRPMMVRSFAGVWLCYDGFKLPHKPGDEKAAEENEAYRDSFFPFHLEVDGPQTSAFLEDHGIVNHAVRKIVKPLAQLTTDYAREGRKDRTPLKIWNEEFPNLRAAFGVGEDDETLFLKSKATLWWVDDGSAQCHYVELPNAQGFVPISNKEGNEPWPNPFGRPAFHFACGFWNPDAEDVRDRYQAFLRPMNLKRYSLDLIESIIASLTASLPLRVLEEPEALLEALKDMTTGQERADFLKAIAAREDQGIVRVIGKFSQNPMPVPELLAKQYEMSLNEYQQLLPRPAPEEITIRTGTVSAITLQIEAKRRRYGAPLRMYASLVHDVIEDCLQFFRVQDKSPVYNLPGSDAYEGLRLITTGSESVKSKAIKAGTKVQLNPETLGKDRDWYTMEVVPIDLSPQAKAARREEAETRKGHGSITMQDYYELHDISNVSEYVEQLETERLLEMFRQPQAMMDFQAAQRYQQMLTGLDLGPIIGGLGPPPPEMAAQNGNSGGTYQVESPRINERPAAVTS